MKVTPSQAVKLTLGVLGAILVGWAHYDLLRCVGDPLYQSDSAGYFLGALRTLSGDSFLIPPHRTYGYPVFLWLTLHQFGSFKAVLLLQHMMSVLTAILSGWMTWRYLKADTMFAIGTAVLSAIMPPTLVSAHSILTETLYGFCLLSTLALYFYAEEQNNRRLWNITGVAACCALLVRPVGWSLPVAGALQKSRRYTAHSFIATLLLVCGINAVHRGFFGLDQFSGISLWGSAARYLEVERLPEGKVKEALQPLYAEAELKEKMKEVNWVRFDPDGPAQAIIRSGVPSESLNGLYLKLAFRALLQHPFLFIKDQLVLAVDIFKDRNASPDIYQDLSFSFFVYRGALLYKQATVDIAAGKRMQPAGVAMAEVFLKRMSLLAKVPDTQALVIMNELRQEDLYRSPEAWRTSTLLQPVIHRLQWLPILALLGTFILLRDPQNRGPVFLIIKIIAIHIALSNLGGDLDRRHLIPIEPLLWAMAFAGMSNLYRRRMNEGRHNR